MSDGDGEDIGPREYLRRCFAVLLRSRIIYSTLAAAVGMVFGITAGIGAELMAPGTGLLGFVGVTLGAVMAFIVAGAEPSPHGRHGARR